MKVNPSTKNMNDSPIPPKSTSTPPDRLKQVVNEVASEKLANLTIKKAHYKFEAGQLKAKLNTSSSQYLKLVTSQQRDELALELQGLHKEIKLVKKELENHPDELTPLKLLRENLLEERKHSAGLDEAYIKSLDEEIAKVDSKIDELQK